MPSGEECVRADRRLLQGLQKEMQQALQLGKAEESRGGPGASQGGRSNTISVASASVNRTGNAPRFQ